MIDLATARETFEASTDYTVGIEEEFALLDPATHALAPRFELLRDAARPDLDLAGDELARDRLRQHRVLGGRGIAQVLEARREVERHGIEEGELLLDPDREVGRGREALRGAIEVDRHRGYVR